MSEVEDEILKEEPVAFKNFLEKSNMAIGRKRIFIFVKETLGSLILNQKLFIMIQNIKCAANLIVAFGFVLKNKEDGSCE